MDIIQAISDPKLFGQLFKDSSTWATWRVFLRGLFGLPMNDADLELFKKYTNRAKAPTMPVKECFAIVGRRGGKSFISAVIACFLALFHDWRSYLAPGETACIMVIATDRLQARVIFGYIKGILGLPIFKNEIKQELAEEIRLKNSVMILVKTCDFRTIRGFTCVAAICDELAFWRSEGSNPSQEILTALRPALATVPGSLLLGISSPYSKTGPLYESFREKYGQEDDDVLVWKAPTRAMNPTISEKIINRAIKEDRAAAESEWEAEFRADLQTFLSPESIDACVIPGRLELPRLKETSYLAFCDPSGGRGDSMTLAVSHLDGERVILDALRVARPPFNPKSVVSEFAGILKNYGLDMIQGDKYSGEWCSSAFSEEGIVYQNTTKTKSEIYLEFLPLITTGQTELLDHKDMIYELRALERRTGQGRDTIDHPRNFHDDIANAAAGAAVIAFGGKGMDDSQGIEWLGPETSGEKWERNMIQQVNPSPIAREAADILALTTPERARQFVSFARQDKNFDSIAVKMGIDPGLLRRWVDQKRDFISSVLRADIAEARE